MSFQQNKITLSHNNGLILCEQIERRRVVLFCSQILTCFVAIPSLSDLTIMVKSIFIWVQAHLSHTGTQQEIEQIKLLHSQFNSYN